MKPQRILFPTDLTRNAQTVLGHAVFHADVYEAELHMLHNVVGEDKFNADPDGILERLDESARLQMAESLEQHRDNVLAIREHTRNQPSTAEAILAFINELAIDFVIMGNHGRSGLRQFFLGSVAEEVVRNAPCPVLTIRAGERIKVQPIRKILVPIDFSPQSKKAWAEAAQFAANHHAKLHLLHVIQNAFHPMGPEPGLQPVGEILPELESGRCDLLAEMAAEYPDAEAHCMVEVGSAYQNIVEHAEREGMDMIIMGSHGYSGLTHLILGSTAERVMRMAHCPVMIVKCNKTDDV